MKPSFLVRPDIIPESELIINKDKTLYHINLGAEHVADNVLLVGDQDRVKTIGKFFTNIEHHSENREFHAITGFYNGTRVTALSTGIGTDNIDIVLNELDAAVNFDLEKRTSKKELKSLNLIRLGTSGSLQENRPVDTHLISKYGLGFDGVMHFYDCDYELDELDLQNEFLKQTNWNLDSALPYLVRSNNELFDKLGEGMYNGITATANGFFGPQGRSVRLGLKKPDLNDKMTNFKHKGLQITNYEMETSSLYGLSAALGHNAVTICAIIANRFTKSYSKDYKKVVEEMIELTLQRLTVQ